MVTTLSNSSVIPWNETCLSIDTLNRQHFQVMVPVVSFMVLLMVIGALGNITVLIVYTFKKHKPAATMFMIALASVDLFSCLVIHPYVILKMTLMFSPINGLCRVFEYLIHTNLSIQLCILLSMAIDRFYAVWKPLKFIQSHQRAIWHIAFSVVTGIICSAPLLFYYGYKTMDLDWSQPLCVATLYTCHYNDQYDGSIHHTAYGAITLLVMLGMLGAITVLYCKVVRIIFHRYKQIKPHSQVIAAYHSATTSVGRSHINIGPPSFTGMSRPSGDASLNTKQEESGSYSRQNLLPPSQNSLKQSTRTAKVLFIVTAIFILSWVPFWTVKLSAIARGEKWGTNVYSITHAFCNHVYFLNNSVNPFIYVISSRQFRNDCRTFWRWAQKRGIRHLCWCFKRDMARVGSSTFMWS